MSVSAVTNSFATYAQKVVSGRTPKTDPLAAAVQEATESRAATIKEAQSGDPIARKKLLKHQAQEQQDQAAHAKPAEPGKGSAVDHTA